MCFRPEPASSMERGIQRDIPSEDCEPAGLMGGGVEQQQNQPTGEERERLAAWYPEYFLLEAERQAQWMLSTAAARAIEKQMDRWPRPRWVRFVDILGARVRLRTRDIRWLQQCTPETRALWRRWIQERQQEDGGSPSGVPW